MSGTLRTKQVRRALRDRIAALSPLDTYTDDVEITATWAESVVPLASAFAPPEPVQPLAFWVYVPRWRRTATRTGRDSIRLESPVTVRFLFPSRPSGAMLTAADDDDACSDAAEHLIEWLTVQDWAEVIGFEVDLPVGDIATFSYVGAGEIAILCEVFLLVRYEMG